MKKTRILAGGIILAALALAAGGCGTQTAGTPSQAESTPSQAESTASQEGVECQVVAQTEAAKQENADSWDGRVSAAILSENTGRYAGEECQAEGHRILDMEGQETETKVYALTMYGEYQFQDGNFVKGSGSGVIPAVLVFQKDEKGVYTLSSYEVPEDGSGYVESIERMFPQKLQKICLSPTEEMCAELESQERQYAARYLDALGRKAKIGKYRDFEHPLLTECGVSVEVSNRVAERRELGYYPYWIGNVEKLEDGVRYIYQMDFDAEEKRILLTKREYDSGKVTEALAFDSETGEIAALPPDAEFEALIGSAGIRALEEPSKLQAETGSKTSSKIGSETGSGETHVPEKPPVLRIHDALSSTMEKFEVTSGNYTWYCRSGNAGEMTGVVACGMAPLDEAKDKERWKLPHYNRLDEVSCTVSWEVMPDSITVREYGITDLGNADAKALSTATYDEIFAVNLKPDRVYEIAAEWKQEQQDVRGFHGSAGYVVVTE